MPRRERSVADVGKPSYLYQRSLNSSVEAIAPEKFSRIIRLEIYYVG